MTTPYQFDPTGTLLANKITGEQHIITAVSGRNYHFIVPTFAPFFSESCTVSYRDIDNNIRYLVEGIDFLFCFQFIAASRSCAKPIYGGISFLNLELAGVVTLVYQTVGGEWTLDPVKINEILSDTVRNPRVTSWEHVAQVPTLFPVVDHEWNLTDLVGMSDVVDKVDQVAQAIANKPVPPPVVDYSLLPTKNMIGLGNVKNFGIATDTEASEGTSITKYMTPRAVRIAIEYLIDTISDTTASLIALAAKTGATLIGTATNQTLDQAVLRVKNIDQLRRLDVPSSDPDKLHTVIVLGKDVENDTSASTYYWSTASTEADNDYTVIRPITLPVAGRWLHEDKDAYACYGFTSTTNQSIYALGRVPLAGTTVKVVVNKFVELIETINFHVNANQVILLEPLPADQRVDIVIQAKPVKVNNAGNRIYQKFTVVTQYDTFSLSQVPVDVDGYCLRLNDSVVLFNGSDFTVSSNQITVSFPIEAGDTLEFMSHFHTTNLPPFLLREIVNY